MRVTANPKLATFSRTVPATLARDPYVQPVEGEGLTLYCRQDFLSADECGGLIAMIEADLHPSLLLAAPGRDDSRFRTSKSCDLDRWHPFVAALDDRICTLLGIKPRHGETIQGQRYDIGGVFRAHHDYFHPNEPYWQDQRKLGGQRSWTAMIYLDEPTAGGETWFSAAGLKVSPRTAMLVAWNNMDRKGAPNPQAIHESLPVIAGRKTIVTKWFRERYWV